MVDFDARLAQVRVGPFLIDLPSSRLPFFRSLLRLQMKPLMALWIAA